MSEDSGNLEGRLGSSGDRDDRLKELQSSPRLARYAEIYRLCKENFSDDLGEMKKGYHALAETKAPDQEIYKAWLKDITVLHRLECLFTAAVVRSYVVPKPSEGRPAVSF